MGVNRRVNGMAAVLVLVAASQVQALSPPPPQPHNELLPLLYETFDGDNWHRNDGWLDPEVHWCDWYGVTCGEQFWPGLFYFDALELADNNLSGELNEELAWLLFRHIPPRIRLDLADNEISGAFEFFPYRSRTVNLADNQLSGELPEVDPDLTSTIRHLRLAHNRFEGGVPINWEHLELISLDLSNNQLEGSPEPAFGALRSDGYSNIHLTDNHFAGALPDWVMEIEITQWDGINLCWNDLVIDDPDLIEWLAERHVGGPAFEACVNRQRAAIDVDASGSWFNPERAGEGLTMMLLDNGQALVYWFTHISQGRQAWLFGVGEPAELTLFFRDLRRTRGQFAQGFGELENPIDLPGSMRLDRTSDGTLHGEKFIQHRTSELPPPDSGVVIITPPPPPPTPFRWDHVRLTQLAGTSCDEPFDQQWISGAWYPPEASGEGFMVELTDTGLAVVYWFTYTPDGESQAWMMGDGTFDGTTLVIDNLIQPRDTANAMPYDATGIEAFPWGTLTLEFHDDLSGHAWFESNDDNYGSGDYPIERLARAQLAECE